MANCITRHIPNTLTCMNLFCGCIACVMAFEFKYEWALTFIITSAVRRQFRGSSLTHPILLVARDGLSRLDERFSGICPLFRFPHSGILRIAAGKVQR